MSSPKVSIITSTYNRSAMLRRAIESVLAQTFTDWEHIIVGDCTPDDSEAVVHSFGDPRLRFYNLPQKSPEGSHGAIAKNHGIFNMARGEFIAYLDDDDRYRPQFLAVMMDYFRKHPEAAVAYCRSMYRDRRTGRRLWGNPFQRWLHGYSKEKLQRYNFLNTNCVIHRKSVAEEVGGWNPAYYFDDYEFWLRISEKYDFHYVNRVLVETYVEELPFWRRAVTKGWRILRHGRSTPLR